VIYLNTKRSKPDVSEYGSVDPAPPSKVQNIAKLESILVDESMRMFERMRVVFTLRNINSSQSIDALSKGFKSGSALLRHEIAYVMGQMQNNHALPILENVLSDEKEHVMVRHEAAEALGAIGDLKAKKTLEKYLEHNLPEISESCEVALDLLAHHNSELV